MDIIKHKLTNCEFAYKNVQVVLRAYLCLKSAFPLKAFFGVKKLLQKMADTSIIGFKK